MPTLKKICVVTPVYEDWTALNQLLASLDALVPSLARSVSVLVIDDGSTEQPGAKKIDYENLNNLSSIRLIELVCNLGNQRAIAVGLAEISHADDFDAVVVMDSDGEDRPEDIPALLDEAERHTGGIVVASRTKRQEPLSFKLLYWFYRVLFRLLTGEKISFGNFSVIPTNVLRSLVFMPDLWNCIPATLLRSKFSVHRCATPRGRRYAGQSKTKTISLMVHGLSIISAYSDVLFVRLLIFSAIFGTFVLAAILGVVWIRLFTDLAIPGWTTNVVLALIIILFQIVIVAMGSLVLLLQGRSRVGFGPKIDGNVYIRRSQILMARST